MKVVIDDCRLERMDAYTEPLEAKIRRQAAEITRLLAENAELKKDLEYYHTGTDTCDIESARAAGQQEAWKLAQKIALYERDGGFSIDELEEIFETQYWTDVFLLTYSEAAAKITEWERKNEICVGDVVTFHGNCGLVTFIGQNIKGISKSGLAFITCKEECTKTGKHIDVNAWLAQIGGESE